MIVHEDTLSSGDRRRDRGSGGRATTSTPSTRPSCGWPPPTARALRPAPRAGLRPLHRPRRRRHPDHGERMTDLGQRAPSPTGAPRGTSPSSRPPYRWMDLSRAIEERIVSAFKQGRLRGPDRDGPRPGGHPRRGGPVPGGRRHRRPRPPRPRRAPHPRHHAVHDLLQLPRSGQQPLGRARQRRAHGGVAPRGVPDGVAPARLVAGRRRHRASPRSSATSRASRWRSAATAPPPPAPGTRR